MYLVVYLMNNLNTYLLKYFNNCLHVQSKFDDRYIYIATKQSEKPVGADRDF
jgi:hypothetical protein